MNHCDEILDIISLRLDGALNTEQEQQLAEHLNACPDCKALAEDLAGIHAAMPGMNVPAPAFIMENVMARIKAEKSEVIPFPVKRAHHNHWRAWGATAAALVLVAAGAFALRGSLNAGGGNAPMTMGVEPSNLPAAIQDDGGLMSKQALPIPSPTAEAIPTATPEPFAAPAEVEPELPQMEMYGGTGNTANDETGTAVIGEQESTRAPRSARIYAEPLPTAQAATAPPAPAEPPKLATATLMLPHDDAGLSDALLTPTGAAERLYGEKFARYYPDAEQIDDGDKIQYILEPMHPISEDVPDGHMVSLVLDYRYLSDNGKYYVFLIENVFIDSQETGETRGSPLQTIAYPVSGEGDILWEPTAIGDYADLEALDAAKAEFFNQLNQ